MGPNSVFSIAEEIAAHGVAVLVMDYPDRPPQELFMSQARGYREVAELLGCAIRYLRHSVEEAGGESGALAVSGFSMGGAPAAHAALAGESLEQLWEEFSASRDLPRLVECVAEQGSTHVDALVGVAGAYDAFVGYEGLYGLEYIQVRDMQLWELLHGAIGLNPDLRVRLLHSRGDDLIPYENSEAFVTVLTSAGIPVELTEFEGPHSTLPHDETVAAVLDVLGIASAAG
jgi:predicted esterase